MQQWWGHYHCDHLRSTAPVTPAPSTAFAKEFGRHDPDNKAEKIRNLASNLLKLADATEKVTRYRPKRPKKPSKAKGPIKQPKHYRKNKSRRGPGFQANLSSIVRKAAKKSAKRKR